jgi:hypothetical protein
MWSHRRGEIYPGCKIKSLTTKAGLPWCPIEGYSSFIRISIGAEPVEIKVGPLKLDLTFRERKTHQHIQNHVEEKVKELFDTDTKKIDYINEIRQAALTGNTAAYNKIKEWLFILPPVATTAVPGTGAGKPS